MCFGSFGQGWARGCTIGIASWLNEKAASLRHRETIPGRTHALSTVAHDASLYFVNIHVVPQWSASDVHCLFIHCRLLQDMIMISAPSPAIEIVCRLMKGEYAWKAAQSGGEVLFFCCSSPPCRICPIFMPPVARFGAAR